MSAPGVPRGSPGAAPGLGDQDNETTCLLAGAATGAAAVAAGATPALSFGRVGDRRTLVPRAASRFQCSIDM